MCGGAYWLRSREGENREMQRVKGGATAGFVFRNAALGLRLKKTSYLYLFFLSAGLVESVRFGSVQSISDFEN